MEKINELLVKEKVYKINIWANYVKYIVLPSNSFNQVQGWACVCWSILFSCVKKLTKQIECLGNPWGNEMVFPEIKLP
jgi:hypothetical protein